MTVSSNAARAAELEIRRHLDGTFRRVHYQDGAPKYVTHYVAHDFIPDYFRLNYGGNK